MLLGNVRDTNEKPLSRHDISETIRPIDFKVIAFLLAPFLLGAR